VSDGVTFERQTVQVLAGLVLALVAVVVLRELGVERLVISTAGVLLFAVAFLFRVRGEGS
jgi:multisubunit Na+/H+ antiporter MnhE subunit